MGVYFTNLNDKMKDTNTTLGQISTELGLLAISNAGDLNDPTTMARLVRAGLGEIAYPVGSQVTVTHSVYGDLVFDVAAHNFHKKTGDENAPTMTLLMHEAIKGFNFDNEEMLWANTTGAALPAGTYNFTLHYGFYGSTAEDGTYQFTTTKEIPKNGGFRHSKLGSKSPKKANVTDGTITTYDASGTAVESSLAVTEGSEGTALGTASEYKKFCVNTIGTFNAAGRSYGGSNNWAESDLRQWLNSKADANKWWNKRTLFDLPAEYTAKAGFLNGFDRAVLNALGTVTLTTDSNGAYEADHDPSESYTTEDKAFLLRFAEYPKDAAISGVREPVASTSSCVSTGSTQYAPGHWYVTMNYADINNDDFVACVIC